MKRHKELLENAEEMGIEIFNAKNKNDSQREGVHVLNPDMEALEDAVWEAEKNSFTMVIVHNRQTWSYGTNLDRVEVGQKLLA